MSRLHSATRKSPAALNAVADAVPPPVPPQGMAHEDRNVEGREMPRSEAPEGIDQAKWSIMNRAQRRAATRRRR